MDRLRAFSARATPVEPDAQGRIYLDERLRNHARLEVRGPAIVLGRLDRIEICSVEPRYERSMQAGEQDFSETNTVTVDQPHDRTTREGTRHTDTTSTRD